MRFWTCWDSMFNDLGMEWKWWNYICNSLGTNKRKQNGHIRLFLCSHYNRIFTHVKKLYTHEIDLIRSRNSIRYGQLHSIHSQGLINLCHNSSICIYEQHLHSNVFPCESFGCANSSPMGSNARDWHLNAFHYPIDCKIDAS